MGSEMCIRDRTEDEIEQEMDHALSGDEDGLMVYWKGNAGTGDMLYDHSGNANHAPIYGATWTVDTTYVSDDNFEQALIDLGYDDALDGYVLTENISGVTSLDVRDKGISDLTGIEDFKALEELSCQDNELTVLDVSNNTALTTLYTYNNDLTALDYSSNTPLTTV